MFHVPPIKQLVPTLARLDAAPLVFQPTPHILGGATPEERARLALGMTVHHLYEAYASARRQRAIEPVMVIASPDCTAGRDFIVKTMGLEALDMLTGPIVAAFSEEEIVGEVGAETWEKLSASLDKIGHKDGMRLLLAVNGSAVEPYVFRMAEAPADQTTPTTTPEET